MGLRSLLEINHDSVQAFKEDPTQFVYDLIAYMAAGGRHTADRLYQDFNVSVVALRHSSDHYYIGENHYGFPARLPYDDLVKSREAALVKAKSLTGRDRRTKRGLEEMIFDLITVIERQQEILDDI